MTMRWCQKSLRAMNKVSSDRQRWADNQTEDWDETEYVEYFSCSEAIPQEGYLNDTEKDLWLNWGDENSGAIQCSIGRYRPAFILLKSSWSCGPKRGSASSCTLNGGRRTMGGKKEQWVGNKNNGIKGSRTMGVEQEQWERGMRENESQGNIRCERETK